MSQPVLAIPVVTPEAAVALFKRLEDQGRSKGNVQQLTQTLMRALEHAWGTAAAKRFSDKERGGWFIDLSDYCDGEMLYGVVRSGPGGSRTLDSVVDADAIESWQRGSPQAIAAPIDDDPNPVGRGAQLQPATPSSDRSSYDDSGWRSGLTSKSDLVRDDVAKLAAKPSPLDPMLVVISVGEPGQVLREEIRRCNRGEVPAIITSLLRHGLGGVPLIEDQIEIWSFFSKPKMEITF